MCIESFEDGRIPFVRTLTVCMHVCLCVVLPTNRTISLQNSNECVCMCNTIQIFPNRFLFAHRCRSIMQALKYLCACRNRAKRKRLANEGKKRNGDETRRKKSQVEDKIDAWLVLNMKFRAHIVNMVALCSRYY